MKAEAPEIEVQVQPVENDEQPTPRQPGMIDSLRRLSRTWVDLMIDLVACKGVQQELFVQSILALPSVLAHALYAQWHLPYPILPAIIGFENAVFGLNWHIST